MFTSPQLKDATSIFWVGLRKDWAKTASYWVALASVPKGKLTMWYAVRSWSFRRQGELIADEAIGSPFTAPVVAFEKVKEIVNEKITSGGYFLHDIKLGSNCQPQDLAKEINAYCKVLQVAASDPKEVASSAPIKSWIEEKEREARSQEQAHDSFEAAVKRRRKGAKWG